MLSAPHARVAGNAPMPFLLLASCGCALFAWLTPTHELPWTSFHAELAMALAALLGGAWVLWRARRLNSSVLPALTWMTLLVALIPLAQLGAGIIVFRGDVTLACLYLLGFALAQIVGYRAAEAWGLEHTLEAFAWVVVTGALASVWLALYQWQQLEYLGLYASDMSIGARPFANLNQPNQLATLLVLGLIATACLFDAGRFRPWVAFLMVALLGFGLAMTQSRAGLLEVPVVGALLLAGRGRLNRRLRRPQVVIALAVVLAMPLVWEAVRDVTSHPAGRELAVMFQAGARVAHWSAMLDAITREPWLGYGWNQGAAAQLAVALDHPAAPAVFYYGHNLVLDLLVWNGAPLGLAIAIGLGLWFSKALRRAGDSATLLALAGVVAVFVHALVEFPLYYAFFLLPVGLLMGGISAVAMPRAALNAPAWLAPALMVIACVALTVLTSDYLGLEEDVRSLRFEQARIGIDRPPHELSRPVLLTQMSAFTRFARTPERRGMSDAELKAMAAVVQRFPSGANAVRYAAALALNDKAGQASDALRSVCKMSRAPECEAMKALWRAIGGRQPVIGRVPWPTD